MTVETSTGVVLREMGADDEDALAAFLSRNDVAEVTAHFHPFPLTPETARRLTRRTHDDRYYVAVDGSEIVALSMLRGWDEGYEVPSFGILVDRLRHGGGVGGSLTDYTVRHAEELGCDRVRLSVYATNTVAKEMYRRRGFQEVSREHVDRPYGSDERIVMVKELRSG